MHGFLFDVGGARSFHESETQQQEAIKILRVRPLTKVSFEQNWMKNGSRLAPAIDMLRNGWGFDIDGNGSTKLPYRMRNPRQFPTKVLVTNELKQKYYDSQHWQDIRERRFQLDNYRCVLCVGPCYDELQCHHVKYDLFREQLDHLMTLCEHHHKLVHEQSRLKFPVGMDIDVAERLCGVISYPFPEWVMPNV